MIARKSGKDVGKTYLSFKWEGIDYTPQWFKDELSQVNPHIVAVMANIVNREATSGTNKFYVLKGITGEYALISEDEYRHDYDDIQYRTTRFRQAKSDTKVDIGVEGSLRTELNPTAERKVTISKLETTLNEDEYNEHDIYVVLVSKGGVDEYECSIPFQKGTIPVFGRNGIMMEEMIEIIVDRIETLNGKFQSEYNEQAITHLKAALSALEQRTRDRIARDVEGKEIK